MHFISECNYVSSTAGARGSWSLPLKCENSKITSERGDAKGPYCSSDTAKPLETIVIRWLDAAALHEKDSCLHACLKRFRLCFYIATVNSSANMSGLSDSTVMMLPATLSNTQIYPGHEEKVIASRFCVQSDLRVPAHMPQC